MSSPNSIPPAAERFDRAIECFDRENSRDPNIEYSHDVPCPRELLYAQRLTEWVLRLEPAASEALRLATRSQHICRWMIPRDGYPPTRAGYLKWRQDLKHFHAQKTGEILTDLGYPTSITERVQALNLKHNLANDPETRILEDALCLVFLEHQLRPLAEKVSEEKVVAALRKSWGKMSERGRAAAMTLPLGPREQTLLKKALGQECSSGSRNLPIWMERF